MSPEEHARTADALFEAERTGRQIGLISLANPGITIDDAYAVQTALVERKLAGGRSVVGWKIGLTSKAMQAALGIDVPDSGVLFDDMVFADGATVSPKRFIEPRIEAEIAFIFAEPVGGEGVTRADVIAATESVAPAIEILDTRVMRADPATRERRLVFDTISDNAANAGVVLGAERHRIADVDLRWTGAIVSRNGVVEETGLGAGVLNDPVESVAWLAQRIARYGRRIEPGEIVLSGSFVRPVECPSGSRIECDFGAFGSVGIAFG